MNKLEREDGTHTADPQEILELQATFYKNTENADPNTESLNNYLSNTKVPQLTEAQKDICEGELTFEECQKVLHTFKNKKSPGNDGITIEFYKKFWPVFGPLLVQSLNESYREEELCESQKQAVLTLLDKGKDRSMLKNWRPISLLNTDVKIASKALAHRITPHLLHIIHDIQVGYVKGRNITDNIRAIEDLLTYTKQRDIPGILMCIDFREAFDTVNWKFLEATLRKFNVGPSLIQWIRTLYKGASSCVINNGTTSRYFTLRRPAPFISLYFSS